MSGHSKWSTIKRKKGANDAKRGKLFTKIIRELTVSARIAGEEAANPQLRAAVQNAKTANMPQATIDRAVRRGAGDEPGTTYEESTYEGYGPGGVAVMVETLTDNKNRTVAEVRHAFTKCNGNLAEKGSVAWMFEQRGVIEVEKGEIEEEDLMMAVMDAGAEDIHDLEDLFEVVAPVAVFDQVKQALDKNEISFSHASLSWLPQNTLEVQGKQVEQIIRLLESLEDLDDVQKVYSNFDIPDDELQNLIA